MPVVEPRPFYRPVGNIKTKRFYKVESGPGGGASARNVSGVGRYLGLDLVSTCKYKFPLIIEIILAPSPINVKQIVTKTRERGPHFNARASFCYLHGLFEDFQPVFTLCQSAARSARVRPGIARMAAETSACVYVPYVPLAVG